MRRPSLLARGLPLAGLITLAACGSPGLGTAPRSLVSLYDDLAPEGVIQIEMDRDGTIIAMEGAIPVESLPASVREAALAFLPEGTVTGAEREFLLGVAAWEVKLRSEGRDWEVVADTRGNILVTEKMLVRGEAPAAVMDTANATVTGGSLTSVELVTRGQVESYHVKKEKGGVHYKLEIAPDGTLLRKVREARAEIEIPLAG